MLHRERFPSYELSYWSGSDGASVAADKGDAEWICFEIGRTPSRERIDLHVTRDAGLILTLSRGLELAFQAGSDAAKREIRSVLGVPSSEERTWGW